MISHKYKTIFVHIPKTAGTSIDTKLSNLEQKSVIGQDHRTILDLEPLSLEKFIKTYDYNQLYSLGRRFKYYLFKRKLGDIYSATSKDIYISYFKFSFVRNSWARILSWYKAINRDKHQKRKYRIPEELSFEAFLNSHFSKHPALRSQLYWIKDSNNKIPLDYIGRFENLQSDFTEICNILGIIGSKLPHKLSSSQTYYNYTDFYNPYTKDLVWKKYKREINFFKFEFGE